MIRFWRLVRNWDWRQKFYIHKYVRSDRCWSHSYARQIDVRNSYATLGVSENCDAKELKDAFLSLAKQYHPDSGCEKADAARFSQIEHAYRSVVEHRKGNGFELAEVEEEELEFDIKHTAPQHRQYLSHEGIGHGTPYERQRQYQQYRVHKAAEGVHEYRMQKHAQSTEKSLVVKDKTAARKIKTRTGLDRLVEDLIQESMQKGEFDNLAGKGKPLQYQNHNPMLDFTTQNLNRILVDNGFAPEWIMLQSEIRKEVKFVRDELLKTRIKIGTDFNSDAGKSRWKRAQNKTQDQLDIVNTKVHKLNIVVPALHMQIIPYTVEREVRKCLTQYEVKLAMGQLPDVEEKSEVIASVPYEPYPRQQITFRMVIKEIKELMFSNKKS